MLAPALLVVDRLLEHSDPKVARAGATVLKAIERVEQRLVAMRASAQERAFEQADTAGYTDMNC